MEEEKVADFIQPPKPEEYLESVLWQWQSGPDPDPWAEEDPAKWTWQNYSDDDSLIIEEAFSLKKEKAELKDYEVNLKRMRQVNKKSTSRTRRVRRQENSRFMMEMSEPVAIVKDQKTMNEAFGTIQHFLDYIMKRTPEAYGLYQRLRNLPLDSKGTEFQDVIQEVIACIEKGAETREKVIKIRSGSQTKDFINDGKRIINLIKNNSATLGDFLKTTLRIYTMETFICYWLNELLRSENWEEINVLSPYLVCLVYTFQLSEYIMKYQEPQGFIDSFLAFFGKQRLYLYRGAALAKEHLELYDSKKIKYFSWNGVTSTSKDKNTAQNFVQTSLIKAKKLNEPKMGVLFQIETDFASPEDCEGMIDVFQNSCSQYPDEQEIILAPGTVFQLIKTRLIENEIYEISLKVTKKFEETKEKIDLLGILQDQAILTDLAIIDGLPSQQSFRLLELLKGNKLIRRLEIRNSKIEDHIMEEIENLRLTMNVSREDVRLIDNTIIIGDLSPFVSYISLENVNKFSILNKIRFKEGIPKSQLNEKDREIKTLILSEKALETFQRHNQLQELSERIKVAGEIEHLDLSMKKMESIDDELINLIRDLKELKTLQNLRIKIDQKLSLEGLDVLCQTIKGLSTLKEIYLGLNLSDEALFFFKKAFIGGIGSVQNLSLDLKFLSHTSDEELDHLKCSLISFTSIRQLSLHFDKDYNISGKGLNHLQSVLRKFTSLRHFSLGFSGCSKISDQGLNHLKNGLIKLTSLQYLSLNFTRCDEISDEGLKHLKDGLISLTSLQHLFLNFQSCNAVSDKGLCHLNESFILFPSLQHLFLNYMILNEGIKILSNSLISLKSLKGLSLIFRISDEGLNYLSSALISLTSLQHLSLDFLECFSISDRGLNCLTNGLRPLISLQSLFLNFKACSKISDEGLNHLKSGLKSLTSIQRLSINLSKCWISDEGLSHLKNFQECDRISDKGLNHLNP